MGLSLTQRPWLLLLTNSRRNRRWPSLNEIFTRFKKWKHKPSGFAIPTYICVCGVSGRTGKIERDIIPGGGQYERKVLDFAGRF